MFLPFKRCWAGFASWGFFILFGLWCFFWAFSALLDHKDGNKVKQQEENHIFIWIFSCSLHVGVTLLGGLMQRCVVLRLWRGLSVMETTIVEPVWRGAFTPWHQTWHRSHPGFSAAQLCFPIKPSPPSVLFTPSLPASRSLRLHISLVFRCLLFTSLPPWSLLSISSFLWPHKDAHSPGALRGEQNLLWKCKACTENATAVGISALMFTPRRSYFVILALWGVSVFQQLCVGEAEAWRGAAGLLPSWKERRNRGVELKKVWRGIFIGAAESETCTVMAAWNSWLNFNH